MRIRSVNGLVVAVTSETDLRITRSREAIVNAARELLLEVVRPR
jgi:hypothetical protein